jgi:hypothetical protein
MSTPSTVTTATPLIDWHVLSQVLLASVSIGVALVTLFSLGVASLSISRSANATTLTRSAWGFYIITQKG